MKAKNLAFKVTLNSFVIILLAFTLVQAFNYIRDALLLETGSIADFASSYAVYMGTRVLPVTIVFASVIFFRARQIEKTIHAVDRGESVSQEKIRKSQNSMRNFKTLIFTLNIVGFATGYVLDLIILKKLSIALELNRLTQLFYNLSSGAVYALAQNAINNILFAGPRELLKIETMADGQKDSGTRRKGLVTTLFIAAYSMLFFYTNHAFAIQQEALYAEALERGVKEGISNDEIERHYQAETSALLATKSSRLQLSPDQIVFPMDHNTSLQRFNTVRDTFIVLFFMILAVVAGVQFASSSEIKNQLRRIIDKMKDILEGDGDLTQRISIIQFDEIGELSDHINRFMLKLSELLSQVADVSYLVTESSSHMQGSLEQASGAVEEMLASAEQVKQNTAQQQGFAAEAQDKFSQLFDSINSITKNVEHQAAFIEETSSSIEEMAANIGAVSNAADRANTSANGLEKVAKDGGRLVSNTIDSIQEIEEASKRVTQIVSMIQDMNEQTNLLAMNAAIEAAHAGQEGKGFAVVANEVKKLAEDGTDQAKRIITYIDTMSEKISQGVHLSDQASATLSRISSDTQESSGIVQEISSAMREQSSGASQIVSAVESVVAATQEIRQKALEQDELGKQLQEYIQRLVAVSTEIDEAAGEQIAGDREVVTAVRSLYENSEKNQEAVGTLSKAIGRFKLK